MAVYLQEIAGQVEGGALHISRDIEIFAEDLGQSSLPDFIQLSLGESDSRIVVFVPNKPYN